MICGDAPLPSIKSDLPRQSSRPIGPQGPDGLASFDRDGIRSRVSLNRPFLVINLGLIIAVCGIFIYFRWDDLGNRDVRGIAFAAFDFISHPTLYARAFIEKPPLAFLMYLPMAFLPAVAGQAIYFAVVIAGEA